MCVCACARARVCVCVSQQMLPTARKTVATVRSNEQCFVIISVKNIAQGPACVPFCADG
jgi:hypothetical protein